MIDIVKKQIIPACIGYQGELAKLKALKNGEYPSTLEERLLGTLSTLSTSLIKKLDELENNALEAKAYDDSLALARFYRYNVFSSISELRIVVDELETIIAKKYWTLPTYAELLYSVN